MTRLTAIRLLGSLLWAGVCATGAVLLVRAGLDGWMVAVSVVGGVLVWGAIIRAVGADAAAQSSDPPVP